jgi:hypothetical protein
MGALFRAQILALALVSLGGCDDACLDDEPDLGCAPLYEPTFDNLYDNTIVSKCAVNGASCHAAAGNRGGLTLEGREVAHAGLASGDDVSCSPLVVRTHSSEDGTQMPPGAPLAEPELCAIRQWVAAGMPR